MIKDEFTINECDKCAYTKTVENAYIILSLCKLHVDTRTNIEVVKSTKRMLSNKFDMKDLSIADVILGIKITRIPNGISVSQSHYVNKIKMDSRKIGSKRIQIIFSHIFTFIRIQELEYDNWCF